ncbi:MULTISPECIES: site-2 protease family protein [Anaerolinea]|uniref:Peptidase M50 family protein n=1 Tax=Anaerolinea thermophila (strain DSM 14523 / JCM 11388 / NBRC 100420 / UNI-1) TaxID=926569 RepID=E8MYF6_ANATU|nr:MULTISPECIES: site-2 protease family protein [Anaerolinea]BAJ62101.1 peptidase M50 family protein [Anaerolinea thermophila UNI-1]
MFNVDPISLISRAITLIVALTLHEYAHARTAQAFGDPTPEMYGRVTLNPLAHLDPLGSLMMIFVGFGWAKPVPINPYVLSRRSTAAPMLVALAGPFSNFLLALAAAIPFRAGLIPVNEAISGSSFLPQFLLNFIVINLLLMFFNLIPLAPLDGDKIIEFFLPPSWAQALERIRPMGPMLLMVILFVLPWVGIDVFGTLLYPPIGNLLRALVY